MDLSFPPPDPAAASELAPPCVAALLRGRPVLPNEVTGAAATPPLAPTDGAFNGAMAARIVGWRGP